MATENGFVSLDEFKTWADAADAADTALEPIPQDWIEETQAEITDEEIEKQQRELAAKMEKLVQLQKSRSTKSPERSRRISRNWTRKLPKFKENHRARGRKEGES